MAPAEVDKKPEEMKADIKKEKLDYGNVLKEMEMSEPDLKKELAAFLRWEKYSGNPLQPVAENKSSGIVVHDGEQWRLYTMHPAVYLHVPPR